MELIKVGQIKSDQIKSDQASSLRKIIDTKVVNMKKRINDTKNNNTNVKDLPRVISITSGKGGVGKTNIVANLAMAFAKQGKKVLILDADLGLANIDIIFGVHPKYNIGHVISGEKEIKDIIVEGPLGIKIVPAGSGFVELTNLTEGQKMSLLSEFEVLENDIDVVLIDTGAGISSNVLYFNLAADEYFVVATPEPTSITDAYAMMKVMFTQHGAKHVKLLVNMVKNPTEAKSVFMNLQQVAEKYLIGLVIEYVGFIPYDKLVSDAVIKRTSVMALYPKGKASLQLKSIAKSILESPRRFDADGNIKFFLNRYIDRKIGAVS